MRDGQEIAEQADEGDPHEARGVRVHQDHRFRRGGHFESTYAQSACVLNYFSFYT